MKSKEINKLTSDELENKLNKLKKDLFKMVIFHCTKVIDTFKINYSGCTYCN